MTEKQRLEVSPLSEGQRLDAFLAGALGITRSRASVWIRQQRVRVLGGKVKPGLKLKGGEIIEVELFPPSHHSTLTPEEGDLDVLFEDDHFLVLNKPQGLVVHPGAGQEKGTLAHRLLGAYPELEHVGGPGRPGIVHRLDKGTSGLLLVARSEKAYLALSRDFAERKIVKTYLALCYGAFQSPRGRIDLPIGRHPEDRKRMAVRPHGGRPALTHYAVVTEQAGVSLVLLGLGTGRTHQLRVHMKSLRHPLVGDPVYGEERWKGLDRRYQRALKAFPRPALHAWRLGLDHPLGGEPLCFQAPLPEDIEDLWAGLGAAPLRSLLPDRVRFDPAD